MLVLNESIIKEDRFLGTDYRIVKKGPGEFYFETFGFISESNFTSGMLAEEGAWKYIMNKRKK